MEIRKNNKIGEKYIVYRSTYDMCNITRDNQKLLNEVYASDFGTTYSLESKEKFISIEGIKLMRKFGWIQDMDEIKIEYHDKYEAIQGSICSGKNRFSMDIINDDTVIFKGNGIISDEIKIRHNYLDGWMPSTKKYNDLLYDECVDIKVSSKVISYIEFKEENLYKPRFCITYSETCEDILFMLTFYKDIKVENSKEYYREYLKSERWKLTRDKVLRSRENKCQLCGDSNGNIHVHHNTYDRVGFEKDEDLIVLCNKCHAKFHDKITA